MIQDNPVRDEIEQLTITLQTPTPRSFRAARVQGLFDIPAAPVQCVEVRAQFPTQLADWSIGIITGASGSGKSTLARHLWPDEYVRGFAWSGDCLLDDFPVDLTPQQIVDALIAVGLSSSPVWLRPYRVLSTGQQFRADLARALVGGELVVFDEFSSVVDRTVAISASVAVAKWVRRSGRQFVAVTCHDDVIDWLQPDWVADLNDGSFTRRCLQRRPAIPVAIDAGSRAAWPLFAGHHYLTRTIDKRARVFLATVTLAGADRLAGFYSLIPALGSRGVMRGWLSGHRTVVLPDFQGLGIGNRMIEAVNEWLWTEERTRVRATTSAPSLIQHRRNHPEIWRCVQAPRMKEPPGSARSTRASTSAGRLTTTWEYLPKAMAHD